MAAALRLYSRMAQVNAAPYTPGGAATSVDRVPVDPKHYMVAGGDVDPATGLPACGVVNSLFAAGRCLFTIDWAPAALAMTAGDAVGELAGGRLTCFPASPGLRGRVGAVLGLPVW